MLVSGHIDFLIPLPSHQYDVISKAILVTAPAFVTEVLLTSNSEQNTTFKSLSHLSELLKQVYYPPIAGVWAAYPDNAFKVFLPRTHSLFKTLTRSNWMDLGI